MVRVASLSVLLFLAGCTLLPFGGRPTGRPGGDVSPSRADLREYRAVFHCHSWLSHDSDGKIETISAAARHIGINVVFLNDHYEEGNIALSPRGLVDGVLFVPGAEVRLPGGGSLLVVAPIADFKKRKKRQRGALIDDLVEKNTFLVAGHVERLPDDHDFAAYGGFEIYNLHAQFKAASRWGLGLRFLFYFADPFLEAAIEPNPEKLTRWDSLVAAGQRLTPLAGHDAHANVRVFGPLGGTIGTYPEVFRLLSTRILATELSEAAILEALRHGRTFIVFDYLGDATGFMFRYELESDGSEGDTATAIVGDEVPFRQGGSIAVKCPEKALIRLIRSGEILREEETQNISFPVTEPGVYRVEVWRGSSLWIVSGLIYLKQIAIRHTETFRGGGAK